MLAQQEDLFPGLFQSILKTISPLMTANIKQLMGTGAFNKEDGDDSDEATEA